MSPIQPAVSRFRAYWRFIVAVVWFFLARSLALREAPLLVNEQWQPLAQQAMLLSLLLVGYASMGLTLDRQQHPMSEQGLPRRSGWKGEVGLGMAVGWALAVACVLPMLVGGGIAIVLILGPSAWGWLAVDAAFFGLLALAEEVAFRGYGFQRFAESVGSLGAVLGYAAFYAIVQGLVPGSSRSSVAVSIVLSLVLSTAYLRTRALWVSWGINFAWKASRALLFGLAISGVSSHSPVVQGNPMGPFWLTGGGFGLDGSWVAFVVLLAALPVVYRLTRDLDFRYNAPVIVPGGIPVDLDAAARRQHEAAMGAAEPAVPGLVQILPAAAPRPAGSEKTPADRPPAAG
jgi:membrane protease YdiL (CAAX protease family)